MTYRPDINHTSKWPYTGQPVVHAGLRADDFYHHAAEALHAELQETEADKWHKALSRETRVTPDAPTFDEIMRQPWKYPQGRNLPSDDDEWRNVRLSRPDRLLLVAIWCGAFAAFVSLLTWIFRNVS